MTMRPNCRFLIYGFFALALSGCGATGKDFSKAKAAGTSGAYDDFLRRHPQSKLREKAEKGKEEALWRETEAAGTATAYLSFLKSRPAKHPKAAEARERARKLLVQGKAAETEYVDFLYRFPDDPGAGDMRRGLEKARFDSLREARDADAYALFTLQYPGAQDAARLGAAVQRRDFKEAEKIGTRLAYQFFLKRYPASGEAEKARARLERFDAPAAQTGNAADLDRLLPRLRRASPGLARRECQKSLSARIRQQGDIFNAKAEELRSQLRTLADSGDSLPDFCGDQRLAVAAADRQTAANAVHALARVMERQQYLASVFSGPDRIAANAQEIGERASTLADDSESQELELEALYGNMPADPKHPEDTASKNAREAMRRAKRAWDVARGMGGKSKRSEAAEVLRMMDRQAELLIEIIAHHERPAAARKADEGVDEGLE